MTITLANITGTITVALGGGDQVEVAVFEVPVTTTLDDDGTATLHGAPDGAIRQAMANALTEAADRLLAGLPSAEVEAGEGHHLIRCADCGATMAHDDPAATLEHGEDGAHIFNPRYSA